MVLFVGIDQRRHKYDVDMDSQEEISDKSPVLEELSPQPLSGMLLKPKK